jgi:hypothetical protein
MSRICGNKKGRRDIALKISNLGHKLARKTFIDAMQPTFFRSSSIRMHLAEVGIGGEKENTTIEKQ